MAGSGKSLKAPVFEIALVCAKNVTEDEGSRSSSVEPPDALQFFVDKLKEKGIVVEDAMGLTTERFLKIFAPDYVLGHMAEELQIRKPTRIGLEVPFEWEKKDVFALQSEDDSLFSWTERHQCLHHFLYGIVNSGSEDVMIKFPGKAKLLVWKPKEALLSVLLRENIVKDILILHDETRWKMLLENWALKWTDFTSQPIDSIYSYFGPKVAIYFAFLGMYTQWLILPAILGLFFYLKDLGNWEQVVPPLFSILVVSWSVLFLQFWKRKNAALLARWNTSFSFKKKIDVDLSAASNDAVARREHQGMNVSKAQKHAYQREEWAEHLRSFRNNAAVIAGILCLQLPFEIAYAHLSYIIKSSFLNFLVTAMYLFLIQYFTKIGGRFAVWLTNSEQYSSKEVKADSLIYKVFGVYFMQSYIGLFYHALFQRDFGMLRQFLFQRLVISQVINNIVENLFPFISYRYAKYKAIQLENQEKYTTKEKPSHHMPRMEKEYLKPLYAASIENSLEDGLFDDFLELALQFGMATMFASAFPLVFAFALINNIIEMRSDALKLLVMLRRPIPRAASSIGAWLNIFQYLGVIAICTNSALLVCLYDQKGTWTLDPGLAAILFMEHALLLVKFGFSSFVPEEPAWVRAKRLKAKILRDKYSRRLLHSIDACMDMDLQPCSVFEMSE